MDKVEVLLELQELLVPMLENSILLLSDSIFLKELLERRRTQVLHQVKLSLLALPSISVMAQEM